MKQFDEILHKASIWRKENKSVATKLRLVFIRQKSKIWARHTHFLSSFEAKEECYF